MGIQEESKKTLLKKCSFFAIFFCWKKLEQLYFSKIKAFAGFTTHKTTFCCSSFEQFLYLQFLSPSSGKHFPKNAYLEKEEERPWIFFKAFPPHQRDCFCLSAKIQTNTNPALKNFSRAVFRRFMFVCRQ